MTIHWTSTHLQVVKHTGLKFTCDYYVMVVSHCPKTSVSMATILLPSMFFVYTENAEDVEATCN